MAPGARGMENPPAFSPLTILIPAAGASSRMRGADKLLEPVEGRPLLRRQAEQALATGHTVLVSLRPEDHARRAALSDLPVTILEVPDAATGMSASLRAGAKAVKGALMVLPGDMPELTTADLAQVIAAFALAPDHCHRGASGDRPGHPVIFPSQLLPKLRSLTGDEGARAVLVRHGARLVPLPQAHALTDLDTPEDWANWRA